MITKLFFVVVIIIMLHVKAINQDYRAEIFPNLHPKNYVTIIPM